ncbi:MAG: hypothetical protein J0H68_04300 [Sphingobacteriia bacterium]|nr:hypothetical protein [Sphingobacteriia bacterium]
MRIPLPIFITLILLFVSSFGMFHVKYQVQNMNKDLLSLKKQLIEENEAIKVLEAEWAYLNKPQRLKSIVSMHLTNMVPLDITQLGFKKEKKEESNLLSLVQKENSNEGNLTVPKVSKVSFKRTLNVKAE